MSFKRSLNSFFGLAVCVTSLVSLAAGSADARPAPSACDRATVLDLDSTSRLSGLSSGEDIFLRVEVPGPGFLSLDATALGVSKAEPVLVPVNAVCDGFPSARAVVLERTMASMVLGIESPGHYVFRLTSSDPTETLSEIKVRTGHSPFGENEDEIENEPDPFAHPGKPVNGFGENEDEIENEPDPFAHPGKPVNGFGEDEDEIENEPDPFADGRSGTAAALCGTGELDDHGDTFGCASILTPGSVVTGEIANDWGDDADVFRFIVPGSSAVDLWRVDLAASGDTDTVGVLFDHHGGRLGQEDSGGSGDNFRWTGILRPGVYFVRVEGSLRAEGAYGLRLSVSVP